MVNQLTEKFGEERVLNCLSSDERREFYITENNKTKQSYIVHKNSEDYDWDECFVIGNVEKKEIYHLSVDGCFLTQQHGYDEEKCDFIAFSNKKFCFVELKINATSENRVDKNFEKAMNQLGSTIDYFDDHKIDFLNHELSAFIVLKNRLYPNDSAGKKARRKAFFDKYEVDLFEESETEF